MLTSSSLISWIHFRMVFRASRSFSRLIIWHRSRCIICPIRGMREFSHLEIKASWLWGKAFSSTGGSRSHRWLHTSRNRPDFGSFSVPETCRRMVKAMTASM